MADPEDILADTLFKAAHAAAWADMRHWNVPIHVRQRGIDENPLAGDPDLQGVAPVFTVGWTGTSTFYPFTADVSVLDGSLNSIDIVTG